MLRWTSGSETCGVLLRHPRSTSAAIVWFRRFIISKTDADSAERIDVVGGARDTDIAAAIELEIFGQQVSKAEIDSADPFRVVFRANAAEKFAIATEFTDDLAGERYRVHELLVIISAGLIPQKTEAGFHSHSDLGRQLYAERKDRAAFNGSVTETARACRKFHVRKKRERGVAAIVSPEIDFQTRNEIADTRQGRHRSRRTIVDCFAQITFKDQA